LVLRLQGVPAMAVRLHDLDLFRRRGHRGAGPFLLHVFLLHSGCEIPCARMNRKCTYIKRTISAGRTNTWSVKNRCRVGGPTTGPPWSSSLMNAATGGIGMPAVILIVTSVAKYALVSQGSR